MLAFHEVIRPGFRVVKKERMEPAAIRVPCTITCVAVCHNLKPCIGFTFSGGSVTVL